MKTLSKNLLAVSAGVFGLLTVTQAQADAHTLHYDNRAYVHAIHDAPNPVSATKVPFATIAYADKAYGQAIYSYPANITFQETEFNVEYVDTAYGQAIYSYPNNNFKPRLELSATARQPMAEFIVPAALTRRAAPDTTVTP